MNALIDTSGNVISRGWVNYVPENGQQVIEYDPSEWPKMEIEGEMIDVDRKTDVKYNLGLNSFETKPANALSIFEGMKFHGRKRVEHRERHEGINLSAEKAEIDALTSAPGLIVAMVNLNNKVHEALIKEKKKNGRKN